MPTRQPRQWVETPHFTPNSKQRDKTESATMSTFLSRLLRPERKETTKQKTDCRKRQSCPDGIEVREGSSSLEKQQRVQEEQRVTRSKKTEKVLAKSQAAKEKEIAAKKKKKEERKKKQSTFSNLLCMGGNTDTLDRTPMPKRPTNNKRGHRPDESKTQPEQISQKYVKRREKPPADPKKRHSEPHQGWAYIMENGIDESEKPNSEVNRSLASSPARLRADGTLERPYVFAGGLTFLAGRKNGREYRVQSCVLTSEELARQQVSADVHDPSVSIDSDANTSYFSEDINDSGEWDPRRAFYLKYDTSHNPSDQLSPVQETTSCLEDAITTEISLLNSSKSPDFNPCMHVCNERIELRPVLDSSPPVIRSLNKIVRRENAKDNISKQTQEMKRKNRYSLPPENLSCVYMGSFENVGRLTVQRDTESTVGNIETEYSKSKRNESSHPNSKYATNSRYSSPQRNNDLVYMGSFEDITGCDISSTSTLRESKRKNFTWSLPNISKADDGYLSFFEKSYTTDNVDMDYDFEMSRNLKEVETSSDFYPPTPLQNKKTLVTDIDIDIIQTGTQNMPTAPLGGNSNTDDEKDTLSPLPLNSPHRHSSPFLRNLGRTSCNPGNKRFLPPPPCFTPPKDPNKKTEEHSKFTFLGSRSFHFPPPPNYTPPKEEMENVLRQLRRSQTSQTDLSSQYDDLAMEDRDLSLKRGEIRRISSSLENISLYCGVFSVPQYDESSATCLNDINSNEYDASSKSESLTGSNQTVCNEIKEEIQNLGTTGCSKNRSSTHEKSAEVAKSSPNATGVVPGRTTMTSTPKTHRRAQSVGIFRHGETFGEWKPTPAPRRQRQNSSDVSQDMSKVDSISTLSKGQKSPVPKPRFRQLNKLVRPQSELIQSSLQEHFSHEGQIGVPSTLIKVVPKTLDNQSVSDSLPCIKTDTDNTPFATSVPSNSAIVVETKSYKPVIQESQPRCNLEQNGHSELIVGGSSDLSEIVYPLKEMKLDAASSATEEPYYKKDSSAVLSLITDPSLGPGDSFCAETTDDEYCAADDEMSTHEEDVTSLRKKSKVTNDLLRSGSVLDRSLILASKYRLRSRDRKCVSQVFEPSQVDNYFMSEDALVDKRVRWAVPEIDRAKNRGNRSADSGTYSDFNSPTSSPKTVSFTFPSHHDEVKEEAKEAQTTNDDKFNRQKSVKQKTWQVRLRKKQWLRRAVSGEDLRRMSTEIVRASDTGFDTLV